MALSHYERVRDPRPLTVQDLAPKGSLAWRIIEATCHATGLTRRALLDEPSTFMALRRSRRITGARHVAMYLLRRHEPHFSLHDIGQIFGTDHATVIRALERLKGRDDWAREIAAAEAELALRLPAEVE